jgi:hypothetical protein
MTTFLFVVLALAIGILAGRAGTSSNPALIDTFHGSGKLLVLLGLGALLEEL